MTTYWQVFILADVCVCLDLEALSIYGSQRINIVLVLFASKIRGASPFFWMIIDLNVVYTMTQGKNEEIAFCCKRSLVSVVVGVGVGCQIKGSR